MAPTRCSRYTRDLQFCEFAILGKKITKKSQSPRGKSNGPLENIYRVKSLFMFAESKKPMLPNRPE
jgi:hypothetical protein